MRTIDLRSDTVTRPGPAMRRAMAEAEVGDDVYGEDPSVSALEQRAAQMLGKPAALLVPSGTMGNQICLKLHTSPGDSVLLGSDVHIALYEAGAPALISGVTLDSIPGDGFFDGADVKAGLRADDVHFPPSRLLCAENTHNRNGGRITERSQAPMELVRRNEPNDNGNDSTIDHQN